MAEVFLAGIGAASLRQQLWLQAAGLGVLWLLLRAAARPSAKPGDRLERDLLAAGLCLTLGEAFCPDEIGDRSICIDHDLKDSLDRFAHF